MALGTAAKLVSVGKFILSVAAMSAASHGLSRLMTRRAGSGSLTAGSPIQMTRDPAAPRRVIYGETRVSGPIIFGCVSGTNNEYLHLVIPLAHHFIWEIGEVYFNDEPLDMPWGSGSIPGVGNKYRDYVRVKKHRGEVPTADADLVAECPGFWTSDHKGLDVAYLYVRLKWDQNVFSGGIPNISVVVKGKQVYDPRDETYKYTTNAALCLLDFMLLSESDGGLGATLEDMNIESFIEAANDCDTPVPLDAGGTEPQYAVNGAIDLNIEPQTAIDELTAAMAGKLFFMSGEFYARAGVWRTPEVSLDESCLR